MRLVLLLLIVAGVVGLGYYRGWFNFSSDSSNDKPNITMSVDKDKIREDKDKSVEEVKSLGQRAKNKVAVTTQATTQVTTQKAQD
jgi:hypothetical protein